MARQLRVGITSSLLSGEPLRRSGPLSQHAEWLRALGADPIVLPKGEETASALREGLDGILFSGGEDISPALYDGDVSLAGEVDSVRDQGEIELVRAASARRIPILCVCRGLQLVNVAFGGSLLEDIKSAFGSGYAVSHHQVQELGMARDVPSHDVSFVPGSMLASIMGSDRCSVNSMHHQAIRDVADTFRVSATASDGVIEAIEARDDSHFLIGVQWHPESFPLSNVMSHRLYEAFVSACIQQHP